ncbi:MAG TPA: aromatic ring-hydroxylating dioxygenase subunit alpha [Candidatus Angelobacter sp.]|nr:aromatic ring-hydroxylating dioxygenase subunit alpha [Candidatus Angelobacter sp.]
MSLKNYWYIAAQNSDVGSRPVAASVYGEHIVLFRGKGGELVALEDRCAHRNMPLSQGKVVGDCLECPYHGWQYDGGGACVVMPSLGINGKLPRHTVRRFPVRERDGFVWAYLGQDFPVEEPFRFPHYGERGWTSFRMKTRFAGTVESCLENFLDCPHTVFVHQGWFRNHDQRQLKALVSANGKDVTVEFQGEPITKSLVSRLFFPKGRELTHTDRFIMPNVSRVDYDFGPDRHFIITSQCTPVAEYETEVYTVITFSFGAIGGLVRLVLEPVCRKIIRQDVDVLQAQTEQLKRFGGPRFAHIETDLLGLQIRSMRRRAEQDQPPREEEEQREITICF